MRLRERFHPHRALSFAGLSAVYFGAYIVSSYHPVAGMVLMLIGASCSAGWLLTLPHIRLWDLDLTSLIRFWLFLLLGAGTVVFLVQQYDDWQNDQLTPNTGFQDPANGKTSEPWCPPPFRCK
jgi:hypothetical protein